MYVNVTFFGTLYRQRDMAVMDDWWHLQRFFAKWPQCTLLRRRYRTVTDSACAYINKGARPRRGRPIGDRELNDGRRDWWTGCGGGGGDVFEFVFLYVYYQYIEN